MSLFFCPLFGIVAVFHAFKVRPLLNSHNYLAAAYHSTLVCACHPMHRDTAQAKKHSINGIVYGLMFLVLFLALHSSSSKSAFP